MKSDSVDVKALVSLEYDGRAYSRGEWFKARPVDALTMAEKRRVSLNREYPTRAARSGAGEKPSKRTYKRRDMVAE